MTDRHPGRPAKDKWPNCKVLGCENDTNNGAFGLCRQHYMQSRKGIIDRDGNQLRELKRVPSYGEGATCIVQGCGNRPKANGLCTGHWQRQQNGLPLDLAPLGPPRGRQPNLVLCCVPECGQRANNRGMCQKHARLRLDGFIDGQGNKLRDRLKPGRPFKPGPILDGAGYHLVPAPSGYLGKTRDGRVLEHRLVMEQFLGRLLEDWELVHHLDGDRSNNLLSNLQLMSGRAGQGEGHPPGHAMTLSEVKMYAEHLRVNDPAAYAQLCKQLQSG